MKIKFRSSSSCAICDSTDFEVVSKRVQFKMRCIVVLCRTCGLLFINPQPTQEFLEIFYKEQYSNFYKVKRNLDDISVFKRGSYIAEFLDDKSNNKVIVEIGAGGGGNLLGFAQHFDKSILAAIEPDQKCVNNMQKHGIKVLGDFFDNREYDLTNYNVVLLSHVLEHFSSPVAVLSKLYKETSDNVELIILVPSMRTATATMPLQDFWFRMVHLYYYSEETLSNLLKKTGWSIKKCLDKNGEIILVAIKGNGESFVVQNFYKQIKNDLKNYKSQINYLKYLCSKWYRQVKKFRR